MFDCIIVFMMAISIIKYTFFWIPSLNIIISSLKVYLQETIIKIIYFVLGLSIVFGIYCHFLYGFTSFKFYDFSYAFIRSNLLLISGNLFKIRKVQFSLENLEYVFMRSGWGITLISIAVIHIFGRYMILNMIVALMRKDINDT